MTGSTDITDLVLLIRDTAQQLESDTGIRPTTVALGRVMAEEFGVFQGATVDGIQIMVVGEMSPFVPWYREHWDVVALMAVAFLLITMALSGPAMRPDCITPLAPILISAEPVHDEE